MTTKNTNFVPDSDHLLDVLYNRRPKRLPLYEHHIDLPFINKCVSKEIVLEGTSSKDYIEFYKKVTGFWKDMTYDGFDFEAGVCNIFPGHGAITGGMLGPIQNRDDFEKYPFHELPTIFWNTYKPHLDAIREALPAGMRAYGGCGYGIFESSQDLVGFEPLCLMQYMDPDLFTDLFNKIGDLYSTLWTQMVAEYSDIFVFFRMGDDLGHKTSTMLEPDTIKNHILPQYKKVIDIVHAADKKFLLHSCGCIFDVMEDIISLGIDAKHSNEDEIAPFDRWIDSYNNRIALFGGFDLNTLCLKNYDEVYKNVLEKGTAYRNKSKGYGLGTGNSIPEYIPVEGFYAMIDAVNEIRKKEI